MRPLLATAALILLGVPLLAAPAGQDAPRVQKSEISRAPFEAGPLKITVTSFKDNVIFSLSRRGGSGYADLRIENSSGDFITFYPNRLSFVSRDGEQVDVLRVRIAPNESFRPSEIRLTPGAHVKVSYRLTDRVKLPARLYYDDRLLAVITE